MATQNKKPQWAINTGIKSTLTVIAAAGILFIAAISYFIHSAVPSHITISAGPEGSLFYRFAQSYAQAIEKSGIKVRILASNGSIENLRRLTQASSRVDIGFVQAGIPLQDTDKLVSLGSIAYQPLLIFYRGARADLLSQFAGKRVAIGPVGSGTRDFALALLAANGIREGGTTSLLDWESDQATRGLLNGSVDAAFVMSEDASIKILHQLLRTPGIHLFSFKQASAYSRKIDYMNVLDLPEGGIDLGKDIPPHDVTLLGPMVELIAKSNLDPALSDLVLEAATEVHSRPGLFKKRGEFPTPVLHAIRISGDASRYYKSGKTFLYRFMPFWLATLLSRILVSFVPMLAILIPVVRLIPAFFKWRTESKIHRQYRELLDVERDFLEARGARDAGRREDLRAHFDRIEQAVNRMQVPAAFADQFYALRGHIDFVRQLVSKSQA